MNVFLLSLLGSSHFSLNSHSAYWVSAALWAFTLHIFSRSLQLSADCMPGALQGSRIQRAHKACTHGAYGLLGETTTYLTNVKRMQLWTLQQKSSSSRLPCTFPKGGTGL